MQDTYFIVREPLLSDRERLLGYEFGWQHVLAEGRRPNTEEVLALVQRMVDGLRKEGARSLLDDQLVVLEVLPALLDAPIMESLPVRGSVLAMHVDALDTEEAVAAVVAARERGFAICLRGVEQPGVLDERLLRNAAFLELQARAPDFLDTVKQCQALHLPSLRLLARGVASWETYEACAERGLCVGLGQLHLALRPDPSRKLNPTQTLILQLMALVRQNADVPKLEEVIKRDPALSYELLRYINSSGFGLGCEIQSLRHAVTLLGYAPLYRWLALLLTTSTSTGYSPALMQAAIIRGRFCELLGAGLLPAGEAENLFVAGMFSLLDRLLGTSMEQVLEQIQLSESVTQALLTHEGIYGPFLALAEACDSHSPALDAMATSLCVGAREINSAQLAAVAWTQSLHP